MTFNYSFDLYPHKKKFCFSLMFLPGKVFVSPGLMEERDAYFFIYSTLHFNATGYPRSFGQKHSKAQNS